MGEDDLLLPCAGKIADDGLRGRCGWLEGQVVQVHPRELEFTQTKLNAYKRKTEKFKRRVFPRDLYDNKNNPKLNHPGLYRGEEVLTHHLPQLRRTLQDFQSQ